MENPAAKSASRTTFFLGIPLIHAILVTMFLFYIDEGYYDFRWMKSAGNWMVFVVYVAMLFPLPFLVNRFMFKSYSGWEKAVLDSIVAIPLTLILIFSLLFSFK